MRKNKLMKPIAGGLKLALIFSAIVTGQQNNSDSWQTYFEQSDGLRTPRYEQTMEYFARFEKASPMARMVTIGKSPQGRDIKCLVVSKEQTFTPASAKRTGKPIVMICNGIHSGEIEGKDACMLLLRDILISKKRAELIDHATLLIVPIFSVDGHERFGKFNRINQNGPEEMGWRTTAQNLNLNRDWVKADTPEMQALLRFFSEWLPDYFIDTHTTDGADFQYSAMYGIEKYRNIDATLAGIVQQELIPFLERRMEEKGYYIAPYVGFKDGDARKGLLDWPGTPRFSTGYMAAQNRISLLIETHMLKPYKHRVLTTLEMISTSLEFINANFSKLVAANTEADIDAAEMFSLNKRYFPIVLRNSQKNPDKLLFRGISYLKDTSLISGAERVTFTGVPFSESVPFFNSIEVIDSVILPFAYVVPEEWKIVVDRLMLHGVQVRKVVKDVQIPVTRYRFKGAKFSAFPYEGHQQVTCGYDTATAVIEAKKGSYLIYTNQRSVRLIASALEPKSADSFLRWGFMNAIFEQKEYFEDYVMEKIAAEMIENDAQLKNEFFVKVQSDSSFRNDSQARLNFFYERSPYLDRNQDLYPIARVENDIFIPSEIVNP